MEEHIQKKARYEKREDEMPSLQPDVAANEHLPSEVAMKSLHDNFQEEEERTMMTPTSINNFHFF
jgi:hypothetical protein